MYYLFFETSCTIYMVSRQYAVKEVKNKLETKRQNLNLHKNLAKV